MLKLGYTALILIFFCSLAAIFPLITISKAQQSNAAPQRSLKLVTEEYPPLNMSDDTGKITGAATELLRIAANKANIALQIRLLPWKRAYHDALEEKEVCIYSTWRTSAREDLFIWVGPLANDGWSFFAPRDKNIQISSLEDTFRYRVGGIDGWAFTQYLQQKGHPFLDLTSIEDETNARKLQAGRIDLWATGRISGRQIIKQKKAHDIEEVYAVREIGLWLACNTDTDPKIIKDLQNALDQFERDGTAKKIRATFKF
ncbi:substrate-binding periplasmic protein [Kiloniella majae]|uniref:substrate-binding periplasmic protein n=1 Tax=Kiloniella majae TaxID=1938558 RepID=UPI000A278E8C|nr:transporter substrate-binding domain-containing protein [Kiloniella majae]